MPTRQLTAILLALCFTGCSQTTPPVVDTKPFEIAIADYCQTKSFGMKVSAVDRVEIAGDTATAVCKMEEAEATTAIKVRWAFTLHRTATGWHVETHTAQ